LSAKAIRALTPKLPAICPKTKTKGIKPMAEHKFTKNLSGLELNEAEQARISGALQRAAMDEVTAVSAARGKAANG
jgi:hypothetical protein